MRPKGRVNLPLPFSEKLKHVKLAIMQNNEALSLEWQKIYAQRRERLRRELASQGLDAILVSHAANRFYLSGFELSDPQCNESAGRLLVCADGSDWLATDSRYRDAALRLWPEERLFIYGAAQAEDLARLMRQNGARIGIEANALSLAFWRKLGECLRQIPVLVSTEGIVERLREIKDEYEIAAMRASFALNHKLMAWVREGLEAGEFYGLSETELSWQIERFFRENGAQGLAFANIAAIGPNSALPHAVPGQNRIEKGRPLLIDVGCRVQDYCSDQTRTLWAGETPSAQFARTYELVRQAQEAAIAIIKPGLPLAEAYAAAREVFVRAGQAQYFTHGLGHGVGLETHEAPSLSPRAKGILAPGMTVTVEPGLYYPEWGGVRLEYTLLITKTGAEIL